MNKALTAWNCSKGFVNDGTPSGQVGVFSAKPGGGDVGDAKVGSRFIFCCIAAGFRSVFGEMGITGLIGHAVRGEFFKVVFLLIAGDSFSFFLSFCRLDSLRRGGLRFFLRKGEGFRFRCRLSFRFTTVKPASSKLVWE